MHFTERLHFDLIPAEKKAISALSATDSPALSNCNLWGVFTGKVRGALGLPHLGSDGSKISD